MKESASGTVTEAQTGPASATPRASEINSTLSKHNINILGQYLKTNDEIGYVVLDIDKRLSNQALQLLKEVKQTLKTRLLY